MRLNSVIIIILVQLLLVAIQLMYLLDEPIGGILMAAAIWSLAVVVWGREE